MHTTIFVHGVGMWPETFRDTHESVSGHSLVWTRPTYLDDTSAALSLAEQVDALAAFVSKHGPARVVGVSDGATLALALAIRGAENLTGIVTHEPSIGSLEPELHTQIAEAAADAAGGGWREAEPLLRFLYGLSSWQTLSPVATAWARSYAKQVCADAAVFADFIPSRSEIAAISVPHLTTVGGRSQEPRHRVAGLLARHGAEVAVVPNAGHLVHVEQPTAFAELLDSTASL